MVNFTPSDKWPSLLLPLFMILCLLDPGESSTHWVVTEDGRIQQQASSVFNLRKPYDLVMFIRQEKTLDDTKTSDTEKNCEKRSRPKPQPRFIPHQKTAEEIHQFKTEFYKTRAECVAARRRIEEFPLHLSFIVSLGSKGVDITKHINLDGPASKNLKPPYCYTALPFSMYAFEHLEGIMGRYQLKNLPEHGVRSALAYVKSVDDWGNRIRDSLSKNATSWVLLNLAALYWRIQGSGLQAVECLRRALHFSSRQQRDVALMSLANVFHHGNHTLDAVVLMHASMEFTNDLVTHLFHVGNMYSSIGFYELAELCYRVVLDREPNFDVARDRLNAVICEQKLDAALAKFRGTAEASSKHKGRQKEHKESSTVGPQQNWYLADVFKNQLQELLQQRHFSETRFNIRTTVVSEDNSSPVHLNEKEMSNLQSEILKGLQTAKGAPFMVDVDLSKEPAKSSSNIQEHGGLDKLQEVECRQISRSRVATSDRREKPLNTKNVKRKKSELTQPAKDKAKSTKNVLSRSSGIKEIPEKGTKKVDQKTKVQESDKNIEILRATLNRVKDVLRDAEKNLEHFEAVAKTKLANLRTDANNTSARRNVSTVVRQEKKNSTEYKKDSTTERKQEKLVLKQGKSTSRRLRSGQRGENGNIQKPVRKVSVAKGGQGVQGVLDTLPISEGNGQPTSMSRRGKPKGEGFILKTETRRDFLEPNFEKADRSEGTSSKQSHSAGSNSGKADSWNQLKHSRPSELKKKASSSSSSSRCTTPEQYRKKRKRKGDHHFDMDCSASHTNTEHHRNQMPRVELDESSKNTQSDEQGTLKETTESVSHASNKALKANAQNEASTAENFVEVISEQVSDTVLKSKTVDASVNTSVEITGDRNALNGSKSLLNGSLLNGSKSLLNGSKSLLNGSKSLLNGSKSLLNGSKSLLNGSKSLLNGSMEDTNINETAVADKNNDGSEGVALKSDRLKFSDTQSTQSRKHAQNSFVGGDTDRSLPNGVTADASNLVNAVAKGDSPQSSKEKRTNFQSVNVSERKGKGSNYEKLEKPKKDHKKEPNRKSRKSEISLTNSSPKKQASQENESGKTTKSLKHSKKQRSKINVSALKDEKKEERTTKEIDSSSEEVPRELTSEECKDIHGMETLTKSHSQFSAWLSFDSKNIDLRFQVNFYEDVGTFREPVCDAKIGTAQYTFDHLKGVMKVSEMRLQPETGLTQTLLTLGRKLQPSVQDVGTRIYRAMQKNSTSWVLSNLAALYWRVLGENTKAVRCLRQALYFSPPKMRDVALVGLASVLLRAGFFQDASTVIRTALQITSDMIVGHFTLGNILAAQGDLSGAIQHYVTALQLQPDFRPAMEKLGVIQCVLWRQQKELEQEAANLKKMLTVT